MRRYRRNFDPYQTEEILTDLFEKMMFAIFPQGTNRAAFKKLLYAVQHHERKPDSNQKSGRKKKFTDEFLTNAALKLKAVLFSETKERISLLRFISTYLPVLDYPQDIRTALNKQEINLAEARSLNRINAKNLGQKYKSKPVEIRKELLAGHLRRKDTQAELARRVNLKLSGTPKGEAAQVTAQIINLEERNDELLELTEYDTNHLLWEEIKGFVYLTREIEMNLITETQIEELLEDLDNLKFKLKKYATLKETRIVKF